VRWNNIFANEVKANTFTGNFTGFLTGNISGSATSLVNSTIFSLGDNVDGSGTIVQASDVVSSGVSYNGSVVGGNVVLTGIIASTFITNKTEVLDSFGTDELVISRSASLRKTTKNTFLRNVPTVPTGAIFPFAGTIVPTGYLLCDGSEQLIANFPELFAVIQYNYKSLSLLTGVATFAIPDFRGRFPLGRDNMGNAGDSSANRVTDVAADTIGGVGGSDAVALTRNNLPQHVHNLKGNAGTQFFAFRPSAGSPPDTNAEAANGLTATGQGQLMVDSGQVFVDDLPSSTMGVPVSITNHYQTVNYIIFTGRIA
jgi:microcystin-dependent protein